MNIYNKRMERKKKKSKQFSIQLFQTNEKEGNR